MKSPQTLTKPLAYCRGIKVEPQVASHEIPGRQVQPLSNRPLFQSPRSLRPRFPNGLRLERPLRDVNIETYVNDSRTTAASNYQKSQSPPRRRLSPSSARRQQESHWSPRSSPYLEGLSGVIVLRHTIAGMDLRRFRLKRDGLPTRRHKAFESCKCATWRGGHIPQGILSLSACHE